MQTHCFALDLHDDPALIEEYKRHHRLDTIWPQVLTAICAEGVLGEEIYLAGNRLFMILHTTDEFSWEAMATANAQNADMQRWEELMWRYQKPLPFARPGEKWAPMEKIFEVRCDDSAAAASHAREVKLGSAQ
jgi:L-rhamnose mutarotase